MDVVACEVFREVLIVRPRVFGDGRGCFWETYQDTRYSEAGMGARFVQDNLSVSRKGALRGLHYQVGRPQAKLVWVVSGEVWDVVVDLRRSSPTFGKWFGMSLSAKDPVQLYIPEGFAHGFCVTGDEAVFCYKCTDYYSPSHERGIRWDDPDLGIPWPVREPILSEKDRGFPLMRELKEEDLFR